MVSLDTAADKAKSMMEIIQSSLFERALTFRENNSYTVDNWDEFKDILENKGGFIYAHWDGTEESELKIKEATKATIRCIPLDAVEEDGVCIYSGKPSKRRVLFAKAY
jgi:prolyl-tRNA synthetase